MDFLMCLAFWRASLILKDSEQDEESPHPPGLSGEGGQSRSVNLHLRSECYGMKQTDKLSKLKFPVG